MIKKISKKGFSLVELLVVIVIIAVLSVVAYSAIGGHTVQARDAKRKQDLGTIQSALELYFLNNSRYPAVLETGDEGAPDYKIPKTYLSAIPKDPSGKSYVYKVSGDKKTYEVASTLEVDGILTSFKSYVVGNGTNVVVTAGGTGSWYKVDTGVLDLCDDGQLITNNAVIGQVKNNNCVPYNPR